MRTKSITYLLLRIIRTGLYIFLVIGGFLVLLWFVLFFIHRGNIYDKCVKLPNGIYLGYEAKVSFDNWRWKPYVVPKFPNGVPVLDGEIWPFRATEATIYGVFEGRNRDKEETFLWQEDTGLIFRSDNVGKFDAVLAQTGPLLDKQFAGGISAKLHYERLSWHPDYGLIDCKTRLFRW